MGIYQLDEIWTAVASNLDKWKDLNSLSLTSKFFQRVVRPLLFRRVRVTTNAEEVSGTVDMLASNSKIASLVHEFIVDPNVLPRSCVWPVQDVGQPFRRFIKALENMTHLRVFDMNEGSINGVLFGEIFRLLRNRKEPIRTFITDFWRGKCFCSSRTHELQMYRRVSVGRVV